MKIDYWFYSVDQELEDIRLTPNEFYEMIAGYKDYKIKTVDTGLSVLHYYVINRRIVAYIEERRHF